MRSSDPHGFFPSPLSLVHALLILRSILLGFVLSPKYMSRRDHQCSRAAALERLPQPPGTLSVGFIWCSCSCVETYPNVRAVRTLNLLPLARYASPNSGQSCDVRSTSGIRVSSGFPCSPCLVGVKAFLAELLVLWVDTTGGKSS